MTELVTLPLALQEVVDKKLKVEITEKTISDVKASTGRSKSHKWYPSCDTKPLDLTMNFQYVI